MGRPAIEHFLRVPRPPPPPARAPLSLVPLTPNLCDNHMEDYLQHVAADVTGTSLPPPPLPPPAKLRTKLQMATRRLLFRGQSRQLH